MAAGGHSLVGGMQSLERASGLTLPPSLDPEPPTSKRAVGILILRGVLVPTGRDGHYASQHQKARSFLGRKG